jgi:hypothetical protein
MSLAFTHGVVNNGRRYEPARAATPNEGSKGPGAGSAAGPLSQSERNGMMKRMQRGVIAAVLGVALVFAFAARADAATNAGVLFLRIAPGARAAAMGEAFVAVSDDATATHYNPAGLGAYPLNDEWEEISFMPYGTVIDAVAVKNDYPFQDFRSYDIWVLTDKGLMVVGPSVDQPEVTVSPKSPAMADSVAAANVPIPHGANSIEISTSGVSSVAAAIRRYAPFLTETQADDIAQEAAATQIGVAVDDLTPLLDRVLAATPEDYRDRSRVENAVREFRRAAREARLKSDRLGELRAGLARLPESGLADQKTLDVVQYALENAVGDRIPSSVTVLINDLFPSPIRTIGGRGGRLYVATDDNLLMLSGSNWQAIEPPKDMEWTDVSINCIELTRHLALWLGTDSGILVRDKGVWRKYTSDNGLPGERVTHIALVSGSDGWAMTDGGLAKLNGEVFSATTQVIANVGDSLRSMLARFLDTHNPALLDRAEAKVRQVNSLAADQEPEAGTSVLVPYGLGIRGDVNVLSYDSYRRLWVGTNFGAARFSQGRWWTYGYVEKVYPEATTASAAAEEYLAGRATPERVATLSRLIIDYNELDDAGNIAAGRPIYLYRNPAAAPVLDVEASGDAMYIATASGQLEVKPGDWGRYYHQGLERDQVRAIIAEGGDMWFVTDDRAVIYKRSHKEATFMYSPWLPEFNLDLYYAFGSYVTNIEGWGTFGLALAFFSYGTIQGTDERGYLTNTFHSFDGALSLSYGTRLTPNLSAGLTGKFIYSRLSDQGAGKEIGTGSATAFALSGGLRYHTPWRRLDLGLTLTNVGPDIAYIDAQQSDPLPRNLAAGFALHLIDDPFHHFMIVGDINKELVDLGSQTSQFKQIIYNTGAEYTYMGTLSLRGGYIYDEDGDVKVATVGLGLAYSGVRIDVAYIPSTGDSPLSNTPRYSLTAQF